MRNNIQILKIANIGVIVFIIISFFLPWKSIDLIQGLTGTNEILDKFIKDQHFNLYSFSGYLICGIIPIIIYIVLVLIYIFSININTNFSICIILIVANVVACLVTLYSFLGRNNSDDIVFTLLNKYVEYIPQVGVNIKNSLVITYGFYLFTFLNLFSLILTFITSKKIK